MLNSDTLEIAIGMAFMFLSVSLVCTAVKEWLEALFRWRALDLERALRTMLADPEGLITGQLLAHPLLDALFQGRYDPSKLRMDRFFGPKDSRHMPLAQRRSLPSYIPSSQFALALLDSVARGPAAKGANEVELEPSVQMSVEMLRASAQLLPSSQLRRAVLCALDHSDGDLAQVRKNIEQWFDGSMERASGWYKRRNQTMLFVLGIAAAAVLNVDALHVMRTLTSDKAFRDVVVKQAGDVSAPAPAASATPGQQMERIVNAHAALESIGLPIGWRSWTPAVASGASAAVRSARPVPVQLCSAQRNGSCSRAQWLDADWLLVLCGWLMTAFAVTLGAPFWFDLLGKFMMVRSTAKPAPPQPASNAGTSEPASS